MPESKRFCCYCRYYIPLRWWQFWRRFGGYDCAYGGESVSPGQLTPQHWTSIYNEHNQCSRYEIRHRKEA